MEGRTLSGNREHRLLMVSQRTLSLFQPPLEAPGVSELEGQNRASDCVEWETEAQRKQLPQGHSKSLSEPRPTLDNSPQAGVSWFLLGLRTLIAHVPGQDKRLANCVRLEVLVFRRFSLFRGLRHVTYV